MQDPDLRIPDAHCHLDALADPAQALDEALAAGVGPVLAVGMCAASSRRALALRALHPHQVRAAVGLHPSEIPRLDAGALQRELDFVRDALGTADALGEVGLDFKDAVDAVQRDRQRQALQQQLEWAAALRKPANVHCRRAEREIFTTAAEFVARTGLGVNLHWFTHSLKLAKAAAASGLFISPGPSILDDPEQAAVAAAIDGDWLLVETDSPVKFGGQPARPAWARQVAERLAALRGESLPQVAARLQANFSRYLHGG